MSRSSAYYSLDLLVAVLLVVVVAIISISIITSISSSSSSSSIITSVIFIFAVAVVIVVDVNVTARPGCTTDVTTTGCTGVYICDANRVYNYDNDRGTQLM